MRLAILLSVLALLLASPPTLRAENLLRLEIGDPERSRRIVPVVLDAVIDTRSDELLTPAELVERLADVDILLIGEQHTNAEFHRVQARVIEELVAAGRPVMVGLEMYPYTEQQGLDHWSRGLLTERGFVELTDWYQHWGYRFEYYRDILLLVREHGLPLFGLNTPREVITAVRTEGFEGLDEEAREHVPPQVDTESDEHRRLFRSYFDEDDEMHGMLSEEVLDGMFRAQCTWDAAMAWNAVQALELSAAENPILVVLVGSGHVAYGLGIERQARAFFDGEVASLIPVSIDDDEHLTESVQASYADFLWGVPEERFQLYPSLGVSLSGSIGPEPTKVIRVEDESPAKAAGIEVGDVLLTLDGIPLADSTDLRRALAPLEWGDSATLRVRRDEVESDVRVVFRRTFEVESDDAAAN